MFQPPQIVIAPQRAEYVHQIPRWNDAQSRVATFLLRTGRATGLEPLAVRSFATLFSGPKVLNVAAWFPILSSSVAHHAWRSKTSEVPYRVAGDLALAEAGLAASIRTFCFPQMAAAFDASGKLYRKPISRSVHTYGFMQTMLQEPLDSPRMLLQIERVNKLHVHYRIGDVVAKRGFGPDLFRYIALNMFLIGPESLPGLRQDEAKAFHEIGVMVAQRMAIGRNLPVDLEDSRKFVEQFERAQMFGDKDTPVRRAAIRIVHRSLRTLRELPLIDVDRVIRMVPDRVCNLLEIKR